MRNTKKLMVITGIIILTPVVYIVIYLSVDRIQQHQQDVQAKTKVFTARTEAYPGVQQEMAQKVLILENLGIVDKLTTSSDMDVCYVNHTDRAWMIESWHQRCYLRSIRGFTTDLTRSETLQRVQTSGKYFGTAEFSDLEQSLYPCRISELNGEELLRFIPTDQTASTDGCEKPNPTVIQIADRAEIDGTLSVKKLAGYSANTNADSTGTIWITRDISYYDEDLGCSGILLCENPRTRPIQAP